MKPKPPASPMHPEELREAGEALYEYGWQTRLAEALCVDLSTVWRWASGRAPVPGPAAVAIRLLLETRKMKQEA